MHCDHLQIWFKNVQNSHFTQKILSHPPVTYKDTFWLNKLFYVAPTIQQYNSFIERIKSKSTSLMKSNHCITHPYFTFLALLCGGRRISLFFGNTLQTPSFYPPLLWLCVFYMPDFNSWGTLLTFILNRALSKYKIINRRGKNNNVHIGILI